MKTNRNIEDLLLGSLILLRHSQFKPAGYHAWTALGELLKLNLGENTDTDFFQQMELLREKEGFNPRFVEKISSLGQELQAYLQPEPGYTPGFTQSKIRELVNSINSFYREASGRNLEADAGMMTEKDWKRLENKLGRVITMLRRAAAAIPVEEDDFRNLYFLREKVQLWASTLDSSFRKKNLGYRLDSISRVNATSGYIWVAFLTDPRRKKVEQGSYSLTFTPLQLRVGLEMGGRSREVREVYYQKFLRGELDELFAEMVTEEGRFIDTFWYFNIRQSVPIKDYLEDKNNTRERFREKIRKAAKRISGENLYTWNVLLPAVLLSPSSFSSEADKIDRLVNSLAETVKKILSRIQ